MISAASFVAVSSPAGESTEADTTAALRIPASDLKFSSRTVMPVDLRNGIGPDEAAVIAVYSNPALRAYRARRGLAQAQVVQAGVLPNPQVAFSREYVTGGDTRNTTNAYTFTAGWEVTALLPFLPKKTAARENLRSVDLDIAWNEWQTVENVRLAVYRVITLTEQLNRARDADRSLGASVETLRRAVEAHEKTVLDQAAAESSSQDARGIALGLEQELNKQSLIFKRMLGLEPEAEVQLRRTIVLPTHLTAPGQNELIKSVELRRLDLLGLHRGYLSQDAMVRAAVLAQFPKISAGFVKASDTSNVHTEGFAITADIPVFDRNQGVVATERATRQKLLDEYNQRVFEAHSDIAVAISDIRSLNREIAAAEEALPLLERLVNSAETAMQEGNTDVLAYYTARSSLLQKRIQVLRLKEQLLEANTALELASGLFMPVNSAIRAR